MNKEILKRAIDAIGIDELNPMQQKTINHATDKRDLILLSPTGSGKTLAYLLPLLLMLEERKAHKGLYSLVLVPSRELAIQVNRVFSSLKSGFKSVCCYGGHSLTEEKNSLLANDASVVIATPGRILDHIERANLDQTTIELLIIDEFDKALEFGFHDEMSQIIQLLPNLQRRILLSATDADEIPQFTGVSGRVLKLDYLEANSELNDRLVQHVVHSPEKDKLETLYKLLCTFNGESTLVFCNHRESVDRIESYLKTHKIESGAFHGGLEQDNRERSLYKFSNGSTQVLVCTDLAARGLDIPEVEHVVHYHIPINEEAFTHRNGRTARWKSTGASYIILHGEESLPPYISDDAHDFEIPTDIPAPALPEWVTLYIGKGKKDKLNVIDIVGFVHKIGKLSKDEVGKIDVKDHFAYVAVKRNVVNKLLKQIQGEKIKGMKTIIQEAY